MSNSIYISIPKPPQNNIKANTPCKKCCGTIDFSLGSSTLNLSSNCYKVVNPNKNTYKYKNKYTKKIYIPYVSNISELNQIRNSILVNYEKELQKKFICNITK
tara:strand:- start:183 stop:491 length:309 start_codon:yes stop_codon:yes gene_type:complete